MCEKDIIDTSGSTDKYPSNAKHETGSRRITRHSICQDINKGSPKKKSITDYFSTIDQPSTSKITNYDSLPRDNKKILENQSTVSSSSSHSRTCEEDLKKSELKRSTFKNVQNDSNIAKSQQNFPQASTSKITCNNGQTCHKNDAMGKTKSDLNTDDRDNKKSISSNDKIGLKSKFNLKDNDSDHDHDSDIELIFEATTKDQAQCSIKLIKEEDSLKTNTVYVKTYKKDCASSQESIDVVNTSSFIDTEDIIIDIEN